MDKIQATLAIGSVLYDLKSLETKLKDQFEKERELVESGQLESIERTVYFQEQYDKVKKAIFELDS